MAQRDSAVPTANQALFDRIALALSTQGYIILTDGLPLALGGALYARIAGAPDEFRQAGVGRGQSHTVDGLTRTDGIRWLRPDGPAEVAYLLWMEQLRLGLNRRLCLGLFDYESHFAVYEPDAFYHKHLDAFHGSANRVLSTVVYLNPHWLPGYGGELLIHSPDGETLVESVTPDFGSMAIFLSATTLHEVAVTHHQRYSIAGWFSVR